MYFAHVTAPFFAEDVNKHDQKVSRVKKWSRSFNFSYSNLINFQLIFILSWKIVIGHVSSSFCSVSRKFILKSYWWNRLLKNANTHVQKYHVIFWSPYYVHFIRDLSDRVTFDETYFYNIKITRCPDKIDSFLISSLQCTQINVYITKIWYIEIFNFF